MRQTSAALRGGIEAPQHVSTLAEAPSRKSQSWCIQGHLHAVRRGSVQLKAAGGCRITKAAAYELAPFSAEGTFLTG
jgi:hypothetical protein